MGVVIGFAEDAFVAEGEGEEDGVAGLGYCYSRPDFFHVSAAYVLRLVCQIAVKKSRLRKIKVPS